MNKLEKIKTLTEIHKLIQNTNYKLIHLIIYPNFFDCGCFDEIIDIDDFLGIITQLSFDNKTTGEEFMLYVTQDVCLETNPFTYTNTLECVLTINMI